MRPFQIMIGCCIVLSIFQGKYFFAFGAYNAITGYFQNVKSFKNEETKLKSILFGGVAQQRAQRAFDLCAAFMQHGKSALYLN
ncbi:DUF945 domain-containing protein [Pinibacter aurantiacus]|jgi:hypothetical protein|uniref:DUF945 domain-containing protein n=1 Tax=Pinibacter aurantiacus TaxID=2851599 RepID=A0A9E2W8W1_9BACT|nr:DUF945 domain-containing protein [Pinibacter aurantiacus]MBV4358772.1 DUF945 domain-containing protein [Pinibacter aurantiacus]